MKNIKTFTLISFLTILPNILIGQDYFPFQTNSAKWSVFSRLGAWPPPATENTFHYFINGDTIFGPLSYSKIYSNDAMSDIIDTANSVYIGGLREDTNKHIYYKPAELYQQFSNMCFIENSTLDEFLLYRFDISIGDTFELNEYWYDQYILVDIDTVQVDSTFRKKYIINNGEMGDIWIEGIGSMTSLFGSSCYVFEGQELLLCYEDSTTFFESEQNYFDRCTHFIVGQSEYFQDELQIYPNPVTSEFHLSIKNPLVNDRINIYNVFGQKVLSKKLIINRVDISELNKGMYIIELLSDNEKYLRKIIIKTKEQYNEYCEILENLVYLENQNMQDEVELLTLLIEKWDNEHNSLMDLNPIELLKSLMTENNMKSKDLVEILGLSKGTVSKILNYHKGLSKETIRKLADYFKLSQEAFNRQY